MAREVRTLKIPVELHRKLKHIQYSEEQVKGRKRPLWRIAEELFDIAQVRKKESESPLEGFKRRLEEARERK